MPLGGTIGWAGFATIDYIIPNYVLPSNCVYIQCLYGSDASAGALVGVCGVNSRYHYIGYSPTPRGGVSLATLGKPLNRGLAQGAGVGAASPPQGRPIHWHRVVNVTALRSLAYPGWRVSGGEVQSPIAASQEPLGQRWGSRWPQGTPPRGSAL